MEEQVYRQFAELERDHWWFRGRRTVYMGLLRSQLQTDPPGRVLDLGCGLGGFLDELRGLGFEVYAADMDHESLRYCESRGMTRAAEVDCYSLPYPDNCFDWVTLFDVVEHIEHDDRIMDEVCRVLKPGGRVMLSVPAYQFLYANNDRVARHYRRYTRGSIERLMENAGFVVQRNTYSNVLLSPLIITTVLALKLMEKLFLRGREPKHTNLSLKLPRPINALLYGAFAAELPLSIRFNLPFGHSIATISATESVPAK
jgi:2-polyprenyl-3-methyl-5-hydroxy-6-metoxy-1,4-benzoquinol methylase